MISTRTPRFIVAAVLSSGLMFSLPAQATPEQDQALAATVKAALLQATPFQHKGVDLQVRALDGAVNVSGWVTHANHPRLAAAIASEVSGVQRVTTNLHTWSSRDDIRR